MIDMKTCPVCGSEESVTIRQATFDPSRIDSSDFRITDNRYGHCWTFKRCLKCRMVYSSPAPEAQDLVRFYSLLDDKEYGAEAEGRSRNFQVILETLGKMTLPGAPLLDIGAANGLFVHLARERGHQAEGIEPSSSLVEEARSRYGIELFPGTLEEYSPGKSFRVVTLLDLIEHISDPVPFLNRINRLMDPEGILVIVTPDIDSLAARILRRRWWHHRIAHINFYPLETLVFLLDRCGFRMQKKRRYSWHFSAFYLVSRLVPPRFLPQRLQKLLKKINLKVQFFDSWEIYAKKSRSIP